jgi:putative membrane protein
LTATGAEVSIDRIQPHLRGINFPHVPAPLRAKEGPMQLAVIVAIVIAIAGVLFAVQNSIPSTVVFFVWRFDGSLGVILLFALALGGLIVALVSTPSTVRASWVIRRQGKEIESLKAANAELRARAAVLEHQPMIGPAIGEPAGHEFIGNQPGFSAYDTEAKI